MSVRDQRADIRSEPQSTAERVTFPPAPQGPDTHLLDKQPGVAGAPEQRRLLQSVFKQGLEGRAEGPSHEVCDPLRHSVVPRDGVLRGRTGSEAPASPSPSL